MSGEFPDRRQRLFGREDDLQTLMARAGKTGLTAVVGRPQIGKTWLLAELARRLSATEPAHLVGLAESREGEPDLPLRAIVDLYARWLDQAGYGQQAEMVWEQQKGDLLKAISSAVKEIGEAVGQAVLKPAYAALDGLHAANDKLRSGGLQLPALQYDQALGLMQAVHGVSGRPLVVILDQWEKSGQIDEAAKLLDSFVRYADQWPPCHVVLGLRSESDREVERAALEEAHALVRVRPGRASLHRLGEMRLDQHERHRVATWVRSTVPAAAEQDDDTLLDEVSGFPGVLMRWEEQRDEITDANGLQRIARDAHRYRYVELEHALGELEGDARRLAIRLALLPEGAGEFWSSIRNDVLDQLDEALIDDLCDKKILENQNPLGFGHAKRLEVARDFLFENRRTTCRLESETLILALGARVRNTDPSTRPFALVLVEQASFAERLDISSMTKAVCLAAQTLFRVPVRDLSLDFGDLAPLHRVAAILAKGLFNTLNAAKAEDDLSRRDALLDDLRALVKAYPDDAAVREAMDRVEATVGPSSHTD